MAGKKRRRNPPSKGNESKTIKILISVSIFSAVIAILMISEGIVSTNQGSIGLVIVLSLIFLFLGRDRVSTAPKRRTPPRNISPANNISQPSLDSSSGLTIEATSPNSEDSSAPIETPKPQLVRAARRKREYISYPINLDGGSYADTYLQLNKDTVLKLRSALWDGKGTLPLPGKSISSLQISEEETTPSEPSPVAVAEPSSAISSPIVPTITPVSTETDTETDSGFDFEWD